MTKKDLKQIVKDLVDRLPVEESAGRAAHGVPAKHVIDMSEFPVKFATSTLRELVQMSWRWTQAEPTVPLSHLIRAMALVLTGDYRGADKSLGIYQRLYPQDPMSGMRFAAPVQKNEVDLPAVTGAWPQRPSFFIGCDAKYFLVFGLPLLRSLAAVAPGVPIHVHLMAENADALATAAGIDVSLTSTWENPAAFIAAHNITRPADYFNAARFIRFAEAVNACDHPLWMLDTDALALQDPRALLDTTADLAVRVQAGRIEPVHHFCAALVMGRPASRPYFNLVSDIVRQEIHRPWWGLDQYALFSAYVRLKPTFTTIGPDILNIDAEPGGVFWFTAGQKKSTLHIDDTPFAKLFRQFAGPFQ